MSFASQFEHRWSNVIQPAVSSVLVNNIPQKAIRVDARTIGDSILTEILTQIGNARLIFADVTTMGMLDGHSIRNGNVMYEVGIAHAVRLPEEVILFRSDSANLLFDVANVRVNTYDPANDINAAKQRVTDAVVEALREVELKRHLAVKRAAESLDVHAWKALVFAFGPDGVKTQPTHSIGQALQNAAHNAAIPRLLEIGAITTNYPALTAEIVQAAHGKQFESMFGYTVTPFGREVIKYTTNEMRLMDLDPTVIQQLKDVQPPSGKAT